MLQAIAKYDLDRWITRVISTSTGIYELGKIDPSHPLSKHVDLSLLLCFSKQCLVENIQAKFRKHSSAFGQERVKKYTVSN